MNNVSSKKPKTYFESLITSVVVILFSISFYGNAQGELSKNIEKFAPKTVEIKARADDDFLLFADYYSGEQRSGGVVVLHDCNNDRGSYSVLAKSLAQHGLHTLLVDLRGYGDSVSQAYSREEAKKKATDIVSYQSEMALMHAKQKNKNLIVFDSDQDSKKLLNNKIA